jgi:CheY-like chemotaxis protein
MTMTKILAVEDEALVRLLVVEALETAGYEVLEAPDGEAALSILRNTPDIALIVSDVRMPRLDGYALALAVRKVWPGIGFLLMTGYSEATRPAELASVKILNKPFDPDRLVEIVGKMVAKN